jgi:hypothetical protein
VVILQLDSGIYFGLGGVGVSVWNFIQTERSIGELVDQMLVEYNVSRPVCEPQILSLLQDMATHKLIDIRSEGSSTDGAVS